MDKNVILSYIGAVAGKYIWLNVTLHIVCYAAVALLFVPGFRYKKAVWNSLVTVLFSSVAAIALLNGNPFNFGIFAIAAAFAVFEIVKRRGAADLSFTSDTAHNIRTAIFLVVALFGLIYPHFVDAHPALMPFVSPLGIIPCPTLTFVLGIANILYPRVNRALYTVLALLGVFYGITGLLLVNVYFDIPLAAIGLYSAYKMILLFRRKKAAAVQQY